MQKKTTTMTTPGGLQVGEGEAGLVEADIKVKIEKTSNCNTLPSQTSNKGDSKTNGGAKSVKFSTLPSPNKGVINNQL